MGISPGLTCALIRSNNPSVASYINTEILIKILSISTSLVQELHSKEQCINALTIAQAGGVNALSVEGIVSRWAGLPRAYPVSVVSLLQRITQYMTNALFNFTIHFPQIMKQ